MKAATPDLLEKTTPPQSAPGPGERRLRMSYEEFLAWADEDTHAEWVDGEVIVHMPPKDRHQDIVGFLYTLFRLFAELFGLGKVRSAPFEVRLTPAGPSREPDIFFVAREHLDRLTPDRLEGPADLIVEVVSPDSVQRDRDQKFREYEAAGVREYWVVDSRPGRQRADFYRLDEEGRYRLYATEDDERVVSEVLPGFWLRPAWLWEEELPDPLMALAEIRGLSPEAAQMLRQMLITGQPPAIPTGEEAAS